MRRLAEVARHLESEPAARAHRADQVVQQVEVVGHPLEGGVRDEYVDRALRPPGAQVRLDEGQSARARVAVAVFVASLADHLRGAVDADDVGVGPAVRERRGQVAGATAQVDDVGRCGRRHPRQQVHERTPALVGEAQILLRVPLHRHLSSILMSRHCVGIGLLMSRDLVSIILTTRAPLRSEFARPRQVHPDWSIPIGRSRKRRSHAGRGRPPGGRLGAANDPTSTCARSRCSAA